MPKSGDDKERYEAVKKEKVTSRLRNTRNCFFFFHTLLLVFRTPVMSTLSLFLLSIYASCIHVRLNEIRVNEKIVFLALSGLGRVGDGESINRL